MIMNFLKKVPAGMMIVPLLIGAIFKYVLFVGTSGRFTYNSDFFKCRCSNSDGNSAGMSRNNAEI